MHKHKTRVIPNPYNEKIQVNFDNTHETYTLNIDQQHITGANLNLH